jgi:hypothetical protein
MWHRKQGGWKREEAAVTVRPEMGRPQVAQRGAPEGAGGSRVTCFWGFVGSGRVGASGFDAVETEVVGVSLVEIDGGLVEVEGAPLMVIGGGFTESEGTSLTAIVGIGGVSSTRTVGMIGD